MDHHKDPRLAPPYRVHRLANQITNKMTTDKHTDNGLYKWGTSAPPPSAGSYNTQLASLAPWPRMILI